ncbi:MAG: hypothetical protein KF914_05800 [Rhizobiaceae bacterium]|nr:hypothetical protein [Rhizobiaceae bacterium]
MDDLRSLIREVLTEELRALKAAVAGGGTGIQRETVSLASDDDLNAFVRRVLQAAADPAQRDAILSGRHLFSLSGPAASLPRYVAQDSLHTPAPTPPMPPIAQSAPAPVAGAVRRQFSQGLLTEKDVEALPDGTRVVSVGKSVRFTPLARDELRRLNIKIERIAA